MRLLNIAKGTTDPRVEFISQVLTQISKSQPNISIPNLKILDKILKLALVKILSLRMLMFG